MTRLLNGRRARAGLPRLPVEPRIRRAGRRHSRWMASTGSFEHEPRLAWAKGRSAGQNLARGDDARRIVHAMMRSTKHRTNLLNPRYRHLGVGAARDCGGAVFYTINLLGSR